MKKPISKEEANARLDLAREIIEKFPFLKDHFRIYSSVRLDPKGDEVGVLEVDVFSRALDGGENGMSMVLSKHLKTIISEGLYNQNKELRKKNRELIFKLEKYEVSLSERKNKTDSKIITDPNG